MNEYELNKQAEDIVAAVHANWVHDPKTLKDLKGNMDLMDRIVAFNGLSAKARDVNTTACIIEIRERIDTTRAQMATMLSKIEELAQAIYGRN
jgi:hypothetical protein